MLQLFHVRRNETLLMLIYRKCLFLSMCIGKAIKETAWERGITTSSFTTLNGQNSFFRRYQRNILFFIDFFSGKNNVNNTNKHLDHHFHTRSHNS